MSTGVAPTRPVAHDSSTSSETNGSLTVANASRSRVRKQRNALMWSASVTPRDLRIIRFTMRELKLRARPCSSTRATP
jgi:hypothetical protein